LVAGDTETENVSVAPLRFSLVIVFCLTP
jgi:hypothetical protein